VVDDFTRECLAAVADTSISGTRVARELDRLVARHGMPATIVSDNGPELTSRAILALLFWLSLAGMGYAQGITSCYGLRAAKMAGAGIRMDQRCNASGCAGGRLHAQCGRAICRRPGPTVLMGPALLPCRWRMPAR
jgi:hypothetical protein